MTENTLPNHEPVVNSTLPEKGDPPPEDPSALSTQVAEMGTYLSAYLEARGEQIKTGAKKALWSISLIPLVLLVMAGILLMGFAFIFYGTAQGLGQWLAGRMWLSYLITGSGLLIFIALAFRYLVIRAGTRGLKKQMRRYERELRIQQEQFGHDAEERAAQK